MTGYKDPPQHSRFRPGHSGNPNGRPKKAPEPAPSCGVDHSILKVAERRIKIRDGDEVREISALEAVQSAQLKAAVNGNSAAARDFQRSVKEAQQQQRREVEEDCELGRQYIVAARLLIENAKKRGEPAPALYPHPDDVIIDPEKGFCSNGPQDAEEDKLQQWLVGLREAALAQLCLDERRRPSKMGEHSAAWLFSGLANDKLFRRYRVTEDQMMDRFRQHHRSTLRELRKLVYRKWKSVQLPVRRGAWFPTIETVAAVLRGARIAGLPPILTFETVILLLGFSNWKSPERVVTELLCRCVERVPAPTA